MPTPFRGKIIAPRVYTETTLSISDAFKKVEKDQQVIIPDGIRIFLSGTVLESLYLHHDDWRTQRKLDPGNDAHAWT